MARVLFALILFAAALLQAAVLPELRLLEVLPDLVLVLLLIWSALRGIGEGLAWVFGVGLVLDALAMDPLGTNGLALVVAALLAGPARRRFFHSGMVLPLALAVTATVGHALVLGVLRGSGGLGATIALQALLNALLVPPLYLVAGWMDRWMVEATA